MEKLGQTLDSKQYWTREANKYTDALQNDYHRHRLEVIRSLIPAELYKPDQTVFDFGCGDAVLFPWFLAPGAKIEGIDVSPEMIELGQHQLTSWGFDSALIQVADVNFMKNLPSASVNVAEENRWKLMFICSTYGSC